MRQTHSIYTISYDGQVMYVGISCNAERRWKQHLGRYDHTALPNDIDDTKLDFQVVESYTSRNKAFKAEDRLIRYYDTINNGWNKQRSGRREAGNKRKYMTEYMKAWRETHRKEYNEYQNKYQKAHYKYTKKQSA